MSKKLNNNFFLIVSAIFVGLLTACNDTRTENPDVVVVSPTAAVSPSPDVVVVSPTAAASPSPTVSTDASPITDVVIFNTTPDKKSLVNRQVQLTNVNVQSVVGDRTFWVGPNNTQQMLVVLDEALDSGSTEKRLDVNAGQTVTLTGLVRALPSTQEAQKQWGLSAAEASALQNQQVYLQASQVVIK